MQEIEEKDKILYRELFFADGVFPVCLDYSSFTERYASLLASFISCEDSSFYHDVKFLEIVSHAFSYIHDVYCSNVVDVSSMDGDFASLTCHCLSEWRKCPVMEIESEKEAFILSWSCAEYLNRVSSFESVDVIDELVENSYRISSMCSFFEDTTVRRI